MSLQWRDAPHVLPEVVVRKSSGAVLKEAWEGSNWGNEKDEECQDFIEM